MYKSFFKKALAIILILCTALPLVSCMTPSKKAYKSKEKIDNTTSEGVQKVSSLINEAQAKNDAQPSISYTYSFMVEANSGSAKHKFGTTNVISATNRNTDLMSAHRKNSFANYKNDILANSASEDFYYNGGNIYTKRFGKNYRSEMVGADFIPYTEYSSYSVNTDFLSEVFYNNATIYNRIDGVTEIVFDDATDYLKSGIISHIGLDQTDYTYEAKGVMLFVYIDKEGYITEKRLKFQVDYSTKNSQNSVSYMGDFSYVLNSFENVNVQTQPINTSYTHMPNIKLLSSITSGGYQILLNNTAISATYKKNIIATDSTGNRFTYDALLDIRSKLIGDTHYYTSIDTEHIHKNYTAEVDIEAADTVGIFIGPDGYLEKTYNYFPEAGKDNITTLSQDTHDYSSSELYSVIANALGAEELYEDEIYSVLLHSEDAEYVTYSINFTNSSTKYFAEYLFNIFSTEDDSVDFSQLGFSLNKCDILIKVRKSDGCLMNQLIDYKATLFGIVGYSGEIVIEGRCELNVNSTEDNFDMFTESDWENAYQSNLS